MNKVYVIAVLLITGILLCSCGNSTTIKADISDYGETPIMISGLLDEDFTITPNELATFECVKMNESGQSVKEGTVSVAGPSLDTFLKRYGKSRSDFEKIRFFASDNYQITLRNRYLTDYNVVFSIASGNDPLPSGYQPLRLCIPKAASSYWIYAVIRIEFVARE